MQRLLFHVNTHPWFLTMGAYSGHYLFLLPTQLVARYISHPEDYAVEKLFSQSHITELAEELLHLVRYIVAADACSV